MTASVADRAVMPREERAAPDLVLRAADDGSLSFAGVASTVADPYTVHDMFGEFTETVRAGAFKATIKNGDVRLLVNHEGVPLARTKSKTMTLTADPDLRVDASLDPTNPTVQEIRSAMGRGDMDQMSIGFKVLRQEWNGDYTEREIVEMQLFDVSVVSFPANPNTSASLRSLLYADLDGPEQIRAAIAKLEGLLDVPSEETDVVDEYDPEAFVRMISLWDHRRAS